MRPTREVVRFGRPLDPFGNDVTDEGDSIDRAGRITDPASFVKGADGEVVDDDQRDAEYTRALGRRLGAAYPRLTVFHSTHLVARAVWDAVCHNAGTRDIYRLLRAPSGHLEVPVASVLAGIDRLRARLTENPTYGAEHPLHTAQSAVDKLETGIHGLSSYHTRPVLKRTAEMISTLDRKLLDYYQNRTAHIPPEAS